MRKKGTDARSDIREAALFLFREQGYEKVTIQDICERAGYTPGTFYYHFSSMQGLLNNLGDVDEQFDTNRLLKILTLPNAWEKLWAIHKTYIEQALAFGAEMYFRIFFSTGEENRLRHQANMEKITQLIVPFIKEGQTNGIILNQTDPVQLAETVGLTMEGVMCEWRMQSENHFDLEKRMRIALETLYNLHPELRK